MGSQNQWHRVIYFKSLNNQRTDHSYFEKAEFLCSWSCRGLCEEGLGLLGLLDTASSSQSQLVTTGSNGPTTGHNHSHQPKWCRFWENRES